MCVCHSTAASTLFVCFGARTIDMHVCHTFCSLSLSLSFARSIVLKEKNPRHIVPCICCVVWCIVFLFRSLTRTQCLTSRLLSNGYIHVYVCSEKNGESAQQTVMKSKSIFSTIPMQIKHHRNSIKKRRSRTEINPEKTHQR